MSWFKAEFAKSNIISGFLAVAIWLAIIFLATTQVQVPDILSIGGTTVIAFFFGAKQGQSEGRKEAYREIESLERRLKNA